MPRHTAGLLLLLSLSLAGGSASATSPPGEVWDLGDLYPDVAAWETAFSTVAERIGTLGDCRGRLGTTPRELAACLARMDDTHRDLLRLFSYAYLDRDTDLRNSAANERFSRAQSLYARYGEVTSFVRPELVALGVEMLESWIHQTAALADFDFFLRETLRKGTHTLSPKEEKLLAAATDPLRTAGNAYQILTSAEMPWPTLTLSTGETVNLTPAHYTLHRATGNRADRKAVFDAFFATYAAYAETLATTLAGSIKGARFHAQARGFDSTLAQSLHGDDIPPAVYETLVREVNGNLPTLHRYLQLHRRMLGVADLQYYDIYRSAVTDTRHYDLTESAALLRAAVAPLGPEYTALLSTALQRAWMHVRPAEGKRAGAYMMGAAYDVHPYLLLNHNDDFESLTTFAHEWGHAMHSLLANRAQPFAKAAYPTFLAEIASIANEVLLYEHLRTTAKGPRDELFFIFQELQGLRGTFFRQTQFAEFELAAHREIARGNALSADRFNQLYGDILKRYLGDAQGVLQVDEVYAVEWAYVPHFYNEFYVYQYATSLAAAYRLMEQVLAGGDTARSTYLDILEAGGSKPPFQILQEAGVDMADAEVYRAVIRRCNQLMDRAEELLDQHPEFAPE